jgi:nucleoid-associated protein YgaU
MIDPAVKGLLGLCILLAGVFAALLPRYAMFQTDVANATQPAEQPAPPASAPTTQLQITPPAENLVDVVVPAKKKRPMFLPKDLSPTGSPEAPATVVTALDNMQPPPIAESYPETDRAHSSSWGMSMNLLMPVVVPPASNQTHKVTDGDTLVSLAERFLGSASRANEIYEANRSMIANPQLLPIGIELKIPFQDEHPQAAQPSTEHAASPSK